MAFDYIQRYNIYISWGIVRVKTNTKTKKRGERVWEAGSCFISKTLCTMTKNTNFENETFFSKHFPSVAASPWFILLSWPKKVTWRHICDALTVLIWNFFAWYAVMIYSYSDLEFLRDPTVEKWISFEYWMHSSNFSIVH